LDWSVQTLNRFQSTFTLLSQPYAPLNELVSYDKNACERMTDKSIYYIADTINQLVLQIFGLQHENRDITDLNQYKRRSRCAAHVYRQLQKVQLDNVKRMSPLGVLPDNILGAAIYMFVGHFPVDLPLSWFFKCVVIATPSEGGAQVDWYSAMTRPTVTERFVCPNIDREVPADVNLLGHLQLQWDWGVTSIPTLVCKNVSVNQRYEDCQNVAQYSLLDKSCWTRLSNTSTKKY
jgi:hypothetical protein